MRSTPRAGYTLLELMVVLAIVVILGSVLLQTMSGQEGDTRIKAAADDVTGEVGMARAKAMEQGRSYRLSISQDGTKLRVAPDDADAVESQAEDAPKPFISEKEMPTEVTLAPMSIETANADSNGFQRLATFLQDGTCKEDIVQFEIRQPGVNPLVVEIRGLTGHVTVNPKKTK